MDPTGLDAGDECHRAAVISGLLVGAFKDPQEHEASDHMWNSTKRPRRGACRDLVSLCISDTNVYNWAQQPVWGVAECSFSFLCCHGQEHNTDTIFCSSHISLPTCYCSKCRQIIKPTMGSKLGGYIMRRARPWAASLQLRCTHPRRSNPAWGCRDSHPVPGDDINYQAPLPKLGRADWPRG